MPKVSVLIPSCNEQYLASTVDDAFAKAAGEIEVIAVIDGPSTYAIPVERPGLKLIVKSKPEGLRKGINAAAAIATGKYLLKSDAHCMFAPGFDELLQADCDADWLVVPRCYGIDETTRQVIKGSETDYYYLSCPWTHHKFFQMMSCFWIDRTNARRDILIDDIMTFQGSMWFMHANYWREHVRGIIENEFGDYAEHQEIGCKVWLGGGRCVVNKKVWYAHDHRSNRTRGYHRPISQFHRSHILVARYWTDNKWPYQIHDFSWLVEKFWPLPTIKDVTSDRDLYWPDDWRWAMTLEGKTECPKSH